MEAEDFQGQGPSFFEDNGNFVLAFPVMTCLPASSTAHTHRDEHHPLWAVQTLPEQRPADSHMFSLLSFYLILEYPLAFVT